MNNGLGKIILAIVLSPLIGLAIGGFIVEHILFPFYEKATAKGYYLGIYQHCMDTEPQRYTIAITQDSHLPDIQDFSPICLEIVREYQRRNDHKLEHRGWQWPLE